MTWYALATYKAGSNNKTALVLCEGEDPRLYDPDGVVKAVKANGEQPSWTGTGLMALIEGWADNESSVSDLAVAAADLASAGKLTEVSDGLSKLAEPFMPPRIFAAASNYVKHAKEMGTVLASKKDSKPYMFIKASTCVIGPGETVLIPPETKKPDWEVELGVVMGKPTRRVSVDDALDYVAGYTIVNDVSARDLTKREDFPFKFDWFQGKSFDTFAPLGPWFVPRECIEDPQSLKLGLSVNGEMMQDATTAEMIFDVREQISYLSTLLTLQPGDVIATGTPTGVGAGRGIFLKPGDVMRATIEKIGTLENPVEAEVTS